MASLAGGEVQSLAVLLAAHKHRDEAMLEAIVAHVDKFAPRFEAPQIPPLLAAWQARRGARTPGLRRSCTLEDRRLAQ